MAYTDYGVADGYEYDLASATIAEEEVSTASLGDEIVDVETMLVMTVPKRDKLTLEVVEPKKMTLPDIGTGTSDCIAAENAGAVNTRLVFWNACGVRFIELIS